MNLIRNVALCIFTIVALCLVTTMASIAGPHVSREILAYFTSGVEGGLDQQRIEITSSEIQATLEKFGMDASSIVCAFPDFRDKDTVFTESDGRVIKLPYMARIYKLTVPEESARDEVIESLSHLSEVLFAEANGIAGPTVVPNDQYYSYQWGLGKIRAPLAWDIYTGNSSNIIGIIDGGIDATHPDLSGKVLLGDAGWGWSGHGIHVAGIAGAKTNNTTGVAGVNWNAQLYAKRVDNTDDVGTYNAIKAAVDYNTSGATVNVLNNSWSLVPPGRYSSTVLFAFKYAYMRNRTAVVAMGNNNGSQTQYPAGLGQGIIAVGNTTQSDVVSTSSNTGNHIDVSAPGDLIYSTYRNPDYSYLSGTSMASPHVAGIASLLKGYNPNLWNDDIEHIIQLSANKVVGMQGSNWTASYGYGRVNARTALDFLRAPYTITQATASGGSDLGPSDYFQMIIYGANGLADAVYVVRKHVVRRNITYSSPNVPHVWGRGAASVGWADLGQVNYAFGWCDVVPGTVTTTNATLTTNVYEVWSITGQWIGWFPTQPSGVQYAYTILSPSDITVDHIVSSQWNIIGIPNFVHDFTKDGVYPNRNSNVFVYQGGYQIAPEPLDNYRGYWVKFPSAQQISYSGGPLYSSVMPVSAGWNMIGSISFSVTTSSIVQTPPGIISSQYFRYDGGYIPVTVLEPGRGYWVQSSQNGTVTLNGGLARIGGTDDNGDTPDAIRITDAAGGSQYLYVRNGAGSRLMPPEPPEGAFDVRFGTGNFVQSVLMSQGLVRIPVTIRNAVYPIIVGWELAEENGIHCWLRRGGTRGPIERSGRIVINTPVDGIAVDAQVFRASLPKANESPIPLPTVFALHQNYPNPFNPSTEIRFDLPSAGIVSLVVYDVLGRQVVELEDGYREVGYHSASWNASDQASGVYFARFSVLNAEGKVAYAKVNKLMLMK